MPASALILFLENLVTHVPELTAESLKTYSDIAHGEGGIGKVQKAVSDLGALLGTLSGASTPAS